MGIELVGDLPRGKTSLVRVGPGQVEVELVEGGLGEEVGAIAKPFQAVELVFDLAMDSLDVALIGMSSGGGCARAGSQSK